MAFETGLRRPQAATCKRFYGCTREGNGIRLRITPIRLRDRGKSTTLVQSPSSVVAFFLLINAIWIPASWIFSHRNDQVLLFDYGQQ